MSSVINLILDGDGAWPDLAERRGDMIHLAETAIGLTVLAGGMTSGRESVAFRFDLPDGRPVLAETSWQLLATAAQAIAARYGWPE
jgi:hypothetical protein